MSKLLTLLATLSLFASMSFGGSKTITLTPIADSDIRQSDPDYAKGDRTDHYVSNPSTVGTAGKLYIKFQMPDQSWGYVASATFKITRTAQVAMWNYNYNLYGLKNSAAANNWQDLSPGIYTGAPSGGLTWNNAPANNTSSASLFTSDATGILGSFLSTGSAHGGTSGETYTISTSDLADFINTDTDGLVTLMLVRDIADISDYFDYFASRENMNYAVPQLVLTYSSPSLLTTTDGADADIRNDSSADANYAKGDRTYLLSRYNWSNQVAKAYVKFTLPREFNTSAASALAAAFYITCTQVTGNNWFVPYDLYGLNDSVSGNDWQDLTPGMYYGAPAGGLTWTNAPANLAGLGIDATKATYLGRFTEPATAGKEISFSNANLLNWLNTDTDGVVTLLFVRRVESGFEQFSGEAMWASRESGTPARLELLYCPKLPGDLNRDCYFNFKDMALLAGDWLK